MTSPTDDLLPDVDPLAALLDVCLRDPDLHDVPWDTLTLAAHYGPTATTVHGTLRTGADDQAWLPSPVEVFTAVDAARTPAPGNQPWDALVLTYTRATDEYRAQFFYGAAADRWASSPA